ncbi:unnamed protein product [Ceutorhynchus assimilis]|uniref:Uncharacterized protein n=1 Tax=Ceutorhynchus assimilis TaxID=467358 RepID=A0A9N9MXM3_9CUCU|nr:unnamed protein product [Ceutorhynchus assimilis]
MAGKSQNLTLKIVNTRVDLLSKQFNDGINILRTEFAKISQAPITISGDCENSEFLKKLNSFQESISSSLQEIKMQVSDIKSELSKVKQDISKMELQHNVNTLLIHGLSEEQGKDLYTTVLSFFQQKLNIQLNKNHINFCVRIGKKPNKPKSSKSRPISVRFRNRWMRHTVFASKKLLKGSKVMITELLTTENLALFKKARDIYDRNNVWTYNGLVFKKNSAGDRELIRDEKSLNDSIISLNDSASERNNKDGDDGEN